MAGIYLHIPYCKVRCHYCDFHFSTNPKSENAMVQAMLSEMELRQNYLENDTVETIYFGGGTPSFISSENIVLLIQKIRSLFRVSENPEITLECNPDDINLEKLRDLKSAGINRFSMGVQSFDNDVLKFMNRAHTNTDIYTSLDLAKSAGFQNITIDLIYGIPGKDLTYWKNQLEQFKQTGLPHLSSYCLTIEKGTFFGNLWKKGKLVAADDEATLAQFQYLMDFCRANGYEQYEVSNFAKPGFISRHNSSYWLGARYLGIGPSAHSYNLKERSWNIRNNAQYIKLLTTGEVFYESEFLSVQNRCNDYILTRLRTKWGIDPADLNFIGTVLLKNLEIKLRKLQDQKLVVESEGKFVLTDAGKYRADGIAADLFI